MKSFKVKTTGKDMLSDIVLAGYDAGVRADQVPPPCDNMLQYGHEGGNDDKREQPVYHVSPGDGAILPKQADDL